MDLTILGVFYDGYEDLWKDFVNLLNKNWPDNPFDVVIANQTYTSSEPLYEKIRFINAGADAEFSKKIQTAIKSIKTDYVLLLLEDFFIEKTVNTKKIEEIVRFIKTNKIVYYSMPIPSFVASKEKKHFIKGSNAYKVSGKKEYVLNCQPAIWKKDFLSLCIGSANYNAWIFEGLYSQKSFIRTQPILNNCAIDYCNPLNILHGAIQGKIIRQTKKRLKKQGYNMVSQRECVSKSKSFVNDIKFFFSKIVYFLHLNSLKRKANKKSVLSKYSKEIEQVSKSVLIEDKFMSYKREIDC